MDPVSGNSRRNEAVPRRRLPVWLGLIALLGIPPVEAGDREGVNDAIAEATAARQQAAAAGGEWRDTEAVINEARRAAQAGDSQRALDLAHRAAEQGKLGYLQAMSQREADFPAYFRP
jgi:hypothetical protein